MWVLMVFQNVCSDLHIILCKGICVWKGHKWCHMSLYNVYRVLQWQLCRDRAVEMMYYGLDMLQRKVYPRRPDDIQIRR